MMDDDSAGDHYELFMELFAQNERALRTYARTIVPGWHDADEVVQEVALIAWRKFDTFEVGTSFIKWVCVIARFRAMKMRDKNARDRLSFNTDILELMADEAAEEFNERDSEYEALENCLAKLPEKQRNLVILAYTPGVKIKEEADRSGVKPGTLYMRLNRIRAALFDCIDLTLRKEAAEG